MGKTKELSESLKNEIIVKYNSGISVQNISELYNISRQTIYYQINKYKKTHTTKNAARSGRPRKTTAKADKYIIRQFKQDVLKTHRSVAKELKEAESVDVSERTIRRRLKEAEFGTYISRVIPQITCRNKLKRLEFAKKYIDKPDSFWYNVLWSDESTFEFHCSKKKIYVRIPKQLHKKVTPTCERASHGGGSVMFWGCVAYNGMGDLVPVDGIMEKGKYLNVLNDHAFPSGDKLIGENFIFQQDNAPCHKAKVITQFLKDVGVNTLDWPPQSPDLNIIENLWAYIKRMRSPNLTRNREDTISEVKALWREIPLSYIQSLVKSVPGRLRKVIDARGGYIFY